MFTFALTTAVKNGWLTGPKYAAAAREAGSRSRTRPTPRAAWTASAPAPAQAPADRSLASQQQFYTSITLGSTISTAKARRCSGGYTPCSGPTAPAGG
jgi:hypothetical protein